MARFTSINHPSISSKLNLFWCKKSQYAINISYHIIDLFIFHFIPEHFWRKNAYYACLRRAIAQILNGDIDFVLCYIIINKMKQQITENKEIYFFGKNWCQ